MNFDCDQNLSRISTIWALVAKAHGMPRDGAAAAKRALMEQYSGAVYRYLVAALRDADAADDLFQEFALRFVSGAFRNADPNRGRFRDFVKRALSNLIIDHRRQRARMPGQLDSRAGQIADATDSMQSDIEFIRCWREELLTRTWRALATLERQGGPPYYTVLRFRATNPKSGARTIARHITTDPRAKRSLQEATVRKILQRARTKFADLLLQEVATSLHDASAQAIEQELIDLELLPYCRSALKRLGVR